MWTHFPKKRLVVKPTVLCIMHQKSSTKPLPLGGLIHFKPIWGGGGGVKKKGGGGGAATLDPPLISYLRMSLTSLYENGAFLLIKTLRLNQSNPK